MLTLAYSKDHSVENEFERGQSEHGGTMYYCCACCPAEGVVTETR